MPTQQLVAEYNKLANRIPNPYARNHRIREHLMQRIEKELNKRGVNVYATSK